MQLAEAFVSKYDETIQLCTYENGIVTFIAFVESAQPVRLRCRIGRQLPVHTTASGKALLAFSAPETLQGFLDAHPVLEPRTPDTITDVGELTEQLRRARETGYATESQESSRNLSCIAAPVRDADGFSMAAVTLCLPSSGLRGDDLSRLVPPLLELTGELEAVPVAPRVVGRS
nr:IclR family transcriptional regulator C-terminal domain-containing protein [Leucobacter weissii]